MESQGQKTSNNPKAMLSSLMSKRQKLQEELRTIEKQVYELETSYLQESSNFGNVWKGYEGFLSSSKNTTNLKRSRKFQHEDRLFSLSSVTSPAAEELGAGREEGRSDLGPGRPKGGGLTINGQENRKREELDQEMDEKSDCRMTWILMMKMIMTWVACDNPLKACDCYKE